MVVFHKHYAQFWSKQTSYFPLGSWNIKKNIWSNVEWNKKQKRFKNKKSKTVDGLKIIKFLNPKIQYFDKHCRAICINRFLTKELNEIHLYFFVLSQIFMPHEKTNKRLKTQKHQCSKLWWLNYLRLKERLRNYSYYGQVQKHIWYPVHLLQWSTQEFYCLKNIERLLWKGRGKVVFQTHSINCLAYKGCSRWFIWYRIYLQWKTKGTFDFKANEHPNGSSLKTKRRIFETLHSCFIRRNFRLKLPIIKMSRR